MKNKKILIANESSTITALLKQCLESEGWTVESTGDGIEALKKIFKDQPDCLIASTDLPTVNGYDLTHIIKNIDGLKNTAIIISSGKRFKVLGGNKQKRCVFCSFVGKPSNPHPHG